MSRLEQLVQQHAVHYEQIKKKKAESSYGGEAFAREEVRWPEEKWPLQAGRYTLIWLPACPRAQRTALSLKLLGMDKVIQTVDLAPHKGEEGWVFGEDNPFPNVHSVRELYVEEPARASQPLLFDTYTARIVTDDQYNLSVYFARDWKVFHGADAVNFYPEAERIPIDRMNGFIYENVNVQIYKAGHAPTKEKHGAEAEKLYATWRLLDEHLKDRPFLLGEQVTDADLRLFPNLLRFGIYHKQFGLNDRHLNEYPYLWRYAKDLYRMPAFRETSRLDLITETHYRSPHNLETFGDRYADETTEETFKLWQTI